MEGRKQLRLLLKLTNVLSMLKIRYASNKYMIRMYVCTYICIGIHTE